MGHSRTRTVLLGTSCLFTAVLTTAAAQADGLPTGGIVVGGSATITSPTATSTIINQTTNKAILTWQDFSIASGSSVTFNQPGSSSIALNRVLGSTPSTINGDLFANGHVWLINGNGILFGKGSQISVGSLIATTADINDQDFMNGNYRFGSASANANAGIVNDGSIFAANGGSVILAGPVVSNNGIIQADLGSVTLGGVSTFSVDFQGDNLLRFAVGDPVKQTPVDANGHPVKALVSNSGTIRAQGGRVLMTTRAAESVVNNVINNTGMIEATSVAVKNGEIVLDAGDGTVELGGTVDASGRDAGETGGSVTVEARKIVVADNTRVDVSGDAGGGSVRIGGDRHGDGPVANAQTTTVGHATITADAITNGDGGSVVIWADEQTDFAGSISARGGAEGGDGGFVETSGAHLSVAAEALVDTLAPKGKTGTWLLDPTNIVIETGGETTLHDGELTLEDDPDSTDFIDPSTIVTALSSTNVMLEASNDIIVVDDLIYSSTHALTLLAQHDIDVHASIQNTLASGGGAINLIAGWDGTTTDLDHLTDAGVYGNNFGGVHVGGEGGGNPSVGGASGLLTVAGDQVSVDASNSLVAQLGFHGAGGGDIRVFAETLALTGGDGSVAQIGNGSFGDDISGDVTGNIDVRVTDQTFFLGGSNGGGPWIGNANGSGGQSTGNVIVITGNFNEDGSGADLGDMVFADLNGGNVTIGETGDNLAIDQNFIFDSPHDLTLLSTSNVVISGIVQNTGSGSLTAIAGWDGLTVDAAHLTDSGVFGNNGGSFALVGGEGGNESAFGTRSGTTTVAGADVDFYNSDGFAQLGFHGDGSGDINVLALHALNVFGGNAPQDFALIGNGSLVGDVTADVSGEINIQVGGLTTFAFGGSNSDGGLAWLGNVTSGDGKASGNVSLITGQLTSYGTNEDGIDPNTLANIITADLGTSADTGGNFTLGITNPNTDFLDAMIGGGLAYDSPHDLSILSTGNLTIANSIQNAGDGDLTILAGWNTDVAPADVLTAPGGYGQNGAFVWVVGATGSLADYNPNAEGDHFVDSGLGTAVGSRGGVTTVGAAQIFVEGLSGYAQIGYHGDGGSGAINVIANGTPGEGGLEGVDACFDGNANICVIGGREGWSGEGALVYAQIGNLGMGVEGSSTADINVRATGNIAVAGGGIYENGQDPGLINAYGMIGSGDGSATTAQNVSGNIDVRAVGQIYLVNSSGENSLAWIGNRTSGEGSHSGNVTLIGDKVDGDDMGAMIAYDLGTDAESGGDFLVGITGNDGIDVESENNYSSPHRLSLLSAGDITIGGTLENSGKGAIDLIAGWDGTTLTPAHFTDEGVYGNNGGSIIIGGEGAGELAAVGSKKGTLTAAGDFITVNALAGNAQLGFTGSGGGDINVFALSDVSVLAQSANLRAAIGNGLFGANTATGDISVNADGDVFLFALGHASFAIIGNVSTGGSESGDISIDADSLTAEADGDTSRAVIGNLSIGGSAGDETGDINLTLASALTLTANNTNARVEIGGGRNNASASGDIDVTANGVFLNSNGGSSFARIGSGGLGNVTGDISVASSGIIALDAIDGGNAIIGFGAGGTVNGDVTVTADGSLTLATGDPSQARIGNATSGDISSDIHVTAGGDIFLLANDEDASATIGTQGDDVTGNIDVESTGGGIDVYATGVQSRARIGNNAGASATGDVTVKAREAGIWLLANASGASALIGNLASGDILGDVDVQSTGAVSFVASDSGDASIGSQSDSAIGGDISVAGQYISLAASSNSQTLIGNRASGDINGAITVEGDSLVSLTGNARIGSEGDALISGDINVVAGGEGLFMSATDTGEQSVVGHSAAGDVNGSIDVSLSDGDLMMLAAGGGSAIIGSHSDGAIDGHIAVSGALMFDMAASDPNSVARVGSDASGDINGDISVDATGGDVQMIADGGGTTQIGHSSGSTIHSDIDLEGANVALTAGDASRSQVGHGANGAIEGNVDITSNGGSFALNATDGGFAWIGSGTNGPVTGGITVTGIGSDLSLNAIGAGSMARIGDGATGVITGDITVTTDGALSLNTDGPGAAALIGSGGGSTISGNVAAHGASSVSLNSSGGGSLAQVGNDAAGDLTGDINVTSDGSIDLLAAHGSTSQIGGGTGGTITGGITVTSGDTVQLAVNNGSGRAWIGQGAAGDVTGDIDVTAANDVTLVAGGEGSIAQIGSNVVIEGTLTGNTTVELQHGAVDLDASGDGATAQIGGFGIDTINGNVTVLANDEEVGTVDVSASGDGAAALIGSGGFPGETPPTASGAVTVHTAGTLTIEAAGNNAYAQVGHHANGGGAIEVRANDLQILGGEGGGIAQLGNGSLNDDLTGDVSGDADIRIADSTILNASGGHAWIGNSNDSGGDHTGNLVFITGTMDDQSEGDEFADALMSDLIGGDVTFGQTDASDGVETDNALLFNSSHTLNLLIAGDITLGGSLQNSGSGAINIVAGWDGTTLDAGHFADAGVFGNGGHGVTIGGNDASGNAAVGSNEGTTMILGDSLTLSAIHGYAQLGYHGAGNGDIVVNVLHDVDLIGGGSTGFFAQIGNGGFQTSGDNSGDISIVAGGDVTLTGGSGADAYVQVGHGGVESNTNAVKYANTGAISVTGQNVFVNAGSGNVAYAQIGNGGYRVGSGLTGTSDNSGDITVTAAHAVALTGNGNDAYAQIGNGGDQLNTNAGGSALGTISGNIVVQAEDPDDGSVTMTAGAGTASYVMIGNGGYSINTPTTAPPGNFTITGNITVSDLALTGGDGDFGYAQIGNGDGSQTGTGNVSGDIFIHSGDITLTDGTGQHSNASIHNAIGHGTVEGNVEGFEDTGGIGQNPETAGTIVVLSDNEPPPLPPRTDPLPDVLLTEEGNLLPPPSTEGEPNPIEEMTGGDGDEKAADQAADQLGNSLDGGNKTSGRVILGGILKAEGQGGQSSKPHSVPSADEDYSSWGNEALWQ